MLQTETDHGNGFRVVQLNDVRHVLAVAVPRSGSTLEAQAEDALDTINTVIHDPGTRGSIVHQAVFVAEEALIPGCRAIMSEFYGPDLPATTYIPQRPCQGTLLAIEALGVGRGGNEVTIRRVSDQVVCVGHNDVNWVHCAQVGPRPGTRGVYNQTVSALSSLRRLLAKQGVGFERIIRTWFYLGGIVEPEGDTQRYKELNRARSAAFEGVHFLPGCQPSAVGGATVFPASTGIGTDDRDVTLAAIALATSRPDVMAVPLENPRQTSAFSYASRYSPRSPKFARAMALSCGAFATIFISGTASITDSESRHVGDVEAQTLETLENIEELIGEDNLRRHALQGLGAAPENLGLARVYIKRPEDFERVRAVCESRLGDVPTVYAVADVCRPELLVEIEGIAFSRRR